MNSHEQKRRRGVALALATGLLFALACSEESPESSEAEEVVDSVEATPETYPVIMTPSQSPRESFEIDPETAKTRFVATRIKQLVRFAYDTHPKDVIYAVPLDHAMRYDVLVTPADNNPETARALLRKRLEDELAIQALRRLRKSPVLVLKRIEGAPPPTPSEAPKRLLTGGAGDLQARKATTGSLARFIRTFSEKPVVDDSGLEGEYDFSLSWDDSQGSAAFAEALSGIGFELVPDERRVEKLIIRRDPGN